MRETIARDTHARDHYNRAFRGDEFRTHIQTHTWSSVVSLDRLSVSKQPLLRGEYKMQRKRYGAVYATLKLKNSVYELSFH